MALSERLLLKRVIEALPVDAQDTGHRQADKLLAALRGRQGTEAVQAVAALAELYVDAYLTDAGDPLMAQKSPSFDARLSRVQRLGGSNPADLHAKVRTTLQRASAAMSTAYQLRNKYSHGEVITPADDADTLDPALAALRALALLTDLHSHTDAYWPNEHVRREVQRLRESGVSSLVPARRFIEADHLWLADEAEQISFGDVVAAHVLDNSVVITHTYLEELLTGDRRPPLPYLVAVDTALAKAHPSHPSVTEQHVSALRERIRRHLLARLR